MLASSLVLDWNRTNSSTNCSASYNCIRVVDVTNVILPCGTGNIQSQSFSDHEMSELIIFLPRALRAHGRILQCIPVTRSRTSVFVTTRRAQPKKKKKCIHLYRPTSVYKMFAFMTRASEPLNRLISPMRRCFFKDP